MSTRIARAVLVALVALIALVMVIPFAAAEETYRVPAVVVSYKVSFFEDLEVEVVDAEGEMWTYFADEAQIGDLVILTIVDFEELSYEDDEIVDVITVGRLSPVEMTNWME